ncbi:hypothetical protein GX48_08144 [Paracoccidioides brasiliensis]|nr:hypothetical protein GX48_08144 [Paracoccidioides brasiliensis]
MGRETAIFEDVTATLDYSVGGCISTTHPAQPLEPRSHFPKSSWANPGYNKDGTRGVPLTVAHRGFKAKYPENTMCAFSHAVKVGAQGLEADMHISKDGVVVISHDATLQRCYGVRKRIIDCDWEYLSTLRTIKPPFEPMPRLLHLLQYIAVPERSHVWLLLDIKLDNDPETIMRAIAKAVLSIPSVHRPWNERIILGCWAAKYLPLCHKYLPTYPVALITYSLLYARKFLKVPNISFSIELKALMGPGGAKFLADVKHSQRQIFVWTVNEESLMRWSVRNEVDGVITDNPELSRKISDGCEGDRLHYGGYISSFHDSGDDGITVLQRVNVLVAAVILFVLGGVFAIVHPVDLKEFAEEPYEEYDRWEEL